MKTADPVIAPTVDSDIIRSRSTTASKRLLSLDILRGLTIAFMILVNNQVGPAPFSQLKHAEWNGFTATDLVFPTFLFLVGLSTVLSTQSRLARGASRRELFLHTARRTVLLILFGPDARTVQVAYAYDSFQLGPLIVDATKAYAGLASIVVAAGLFAFFRFTTVGTAIRACADNYIGALVVGLDVKHLYALTFGIGAACVGAAGVMLLLIVDVTPSLGPSYTLLAFVIVITGGLGSMPGALVGGVLIGLTEAMAGLLFTPSAKSMFSFAILVLVLRLRPPGIMGTRAA